jgi:hypothetical protein
MRHCFCFPNSIYIEAKPLIVGYVLAELDAPKQMEMEFLLRGLYFTIFMRNKDRVHGMIISADQLQI